MKQTPGETDRCTQQCAPSQAIGLAKAELLSDEDARQVAEVFKVLGDVTRVKILHALSRRELCVCDLAAVVAMGQSAVSHQLRLLRGLRLVKYRKEGKMVWYALDDQHVFSLLSQGVEHVTHR
jgi:DNA-binding transcriptional ArsR family regulator